VDRRAGERDARRASRHRTEPHLIALGHAAAAAAHRVRYFNIADLVETLCPCPSYLTKCRIALTLVGMGRTSARGRRNGVRDTRTALGLTQAELAGDVGVARQTVVAVEAGDYAPSVYLALALARRLGVTVEQLFAEEREAGRPGRSDNVEAAR